MDVNSYSVMIKRENGVVSCLLSEIGSGIGRELKSTTFTLETVLGDFLDEDRWEEHPLLKLYGSNGHKVMCGGSLEYLGGSFPFESFSLISRVFVPEVFNKLSKSDFERIKLGESCVPDFRYWIYVGVEEEHRHTMDSDPYYEGRRDGFLYGFTQFSPLTDSFDPLEGFVRGKAQRSVCFEYECNRLKEIALAVLHYCLIDGYKTAYCQHCGKLFATQSLKNKYCKRNSPYKGYTHLNCELAVKRIKGKLRSRYGVVRTPLYNRDDGLERLREVSDSYNSFMAEIRRCASVSNLKKCDDYLFDDCKTIRKKYERVRR